MKPAAFDFIRAESLEEVLDALAQYGSDARIIAGGQSLMAMLNMRLAQPSVLIDIMRLKALAQVSPTKSGLHVGAGVRQAELLARPDLGQQQPLLCAALPWVGHWQTRARGTACGSVAHADPSAEIPLCLVALGGEIQLRSRKTSRRVGAKDFFIGMMSTARGDDEMIESISFPNRIPGAGYSFMEVGRRHGDFAMVACAAVADAAAVRLAIGGVADKPTAIDLPILTGSALDDALNGFAWSLNGRDDVHATARYRRDLVRKLGRRVIEEALQCRA